MAVLRWSGYLRPDQFLDHLTVIKMKNVGNGFKMGRWEVGFLQVGAWVFIGGYLVVNLVHE